MGTKATTANQGSQANSADPDQMPHKAASDQGLHCFLTKFNFKKMKNTTKQPLNW